MFDIKNIFNFIKKNFTPYDVFVIVILAGLYFATRLINLDQWPIFSDEGIYIRWAKVAWHDPSWRFISVTDGRQPLQTWATIPFLKLFPDNALLAGRLFSVATGFIGLLGMFSLCFYLFGKRAAFMAASFFIFIPYFIFYDRIALVDSAVNAGFIWILFFSILLVKTRRLDIALIFGFIGGIALLAKSSSRMFIMIAATAPLLIYNLKKKTESLLQSVNYLILFTIAFGVGFFFYNVQRLSPFFHYVAIKNTTFVMTFQEFLQTPFAYVHNFRLIPIYATWEAGFVIVPFSIIGLYLLYKKDFRLFLYLMIFIIAPYVAIGFFAKILFPRYVIFYASIFIITATYALMQLKNLKTRSFAVGFIVATMLVFDYPLIFNPAKANFPEIDRGQYIEGATAVWGAPELMETMRERSHEKPVFIMAEGDFGLVADVLNVFLKDGDQIEIKGFWPLDEKHLYEYQPELAKRQVYVVFSHRKEFPDSWPIELVKEYDKPGNKESLYLFKLKSQ